MSRSLKNFRTLVCIPVFRDNLHNRNHRAVLRPATAHPSEDKAEVRDIPENKREDFNRISKKWAD
jgi:hypothetical protein